MALGLSVGLLLHPADSVRHALRLIIIIIIIIIISFIKTMTNRIVTIDKKTMNEKLK